MRVAMPLALVPAAMWHNREPQKNRDSGSSLFGIFQIVLTAHGCQLAVARGLEGETCLSIAVNVEHFRSSGPRSNPFHGFTGCKSRSSSPRFGATCEEILPYAKAPSAALFGDMQARPDLGSSWFSG
jgi:hypothetical protein